MSLRAVAGSGVNSGSGSSLFNSSAFASLPAAASSSGLIYRVSDINNSLWMSNGTIWKPVGGQAVLASSAAQLTVPGDTNENVLATITVPANSMSANGTLSVLTYWSANNNANAKTPRVRFSGAAGTPVTGQTLANSVTERFLVNISNRAATNSQVFDPGTGGVGTGGWGVSTAAVTTAAVDTTAATSVVISGQMANAGDTMILERYLILLIVP